MRKSLLSNHQQVGQKISQKELMKNFCAIKKLSSKRYVKNNRLSRTKT